MISAYVNWLHDEQQPAVGLLYCHLRTGRGGPRLPCPAGHVWPRRESVILRGVVGTAGVEALIADWRHDMVKPLRVLRQRWRETPCAASVRDEIKSLELRAERQQQDTMYAYYQESAGLSWAAQPLRENLMLVASFSGQEGDGRFAAIDRLVLLFSP
jgi:hypothetical protein